MIFDLASQSKGCVHQGSKDVIITLTQNIVSYHLQQAEITAFNAVHAGEKLLTARVCG